MVDPGSKLIDEDRYLTLDEYEEMSFEFWREQDKKCWKVIGQALFAFTASVTILAIYLFL